ncbi:MAG: ATP-dependent DNA helicase RecG, partial [Erysipelotrichaceae bacterium]|nr:ATP-dependent DNA helicase RecG [Erysipelotrichaceae bacterium]
DYQQKYRLLSRKQAFCYIHQPQDKQQIEQALRTLKYEEFLKFFLTILCVQDESFNGLDKQPKIFDQEQVFSLQQNLPFMLTKDQIFVIKEILDDLASYHVMYRLVQGDVGCGKTMVCAFAMYATIIAGYQTVLLAPTEVLVKQHFATIQELFRHTPLKIAMLYSAMNAKEKSTIIEQIKKGEIDCVIGTHSLIQDEVRFRKLGLVVVDEQQRFGVEQRQKIKAKGEKVDFLLMSATPIPRTLANTLYGDMAVSTIESLPSNRKGVDTFLIEENSIRSIMQDIRNTINMGQQVYVICPSIEQNDAYQARNVVDICNNLKEAFIGFCKVEMMHGKMSSDEKTKIIADFQKGLFEILVSTTVVEVGVNVVNATMMIIYDAHRFGLSQLHQLRGRVQRGSLKGKCYLLTSTKDPQSLERLKILVKTNNGFEISQQDLLLRGPGDILGTRQSGSSGFILGNIFKDQNIIEQAQKDARVIARDKKYHKLIDYIIDENKNNVNYRD